MLNYKVFKTERVDMTNKVNYIRKSAKYIIGAAVLATGLSSVAFGLEKDNDGYYKILNKAELKEFAEKVNSGEEPNANAKLMNDIVFNEGSVLDEKGDFKGGDLEEFTPIGTIVNQFKGRFIGNDKTIKGLYVYQENNNDQGLFGVIGEGGKVGNIELENSYIRGQKFVGGIAGYNKGTIENCIISGYSAIVGDDYVGGNVGNNEGTIAGKCENSGVVIGRDNIGGNVGWNEGTITGKCENSGVVKGDYSVGGNVGRSITKNAKIGNCINLGIIEGKNVVGGNVGCNDIGTITGECKNNGKVEGSENIGGNVGWNGGTMEGECNNIGVVTGQMEVGGNVGCNYRGTISNYCVNCAERIEGSSSVGGNIGYNEGSIICDNLDEYDALLVCINDENKIGEVKGNSAVGGNVGWNSGTIEAKKGGVCINEEKVTGQTGVGGNVGRNVGTMTGECGNNGEVTGQMEVGGNIGLNFNAKISENNLINSGTVNGESADKAKEIGRSEN